MKWNNISWLMFIFLLFNLISFVIIKFDLNYLHSSILYALYIILIFTDRKDVSNNRTNTRGESKDV